MGDFFFILLFLSFFCFFLFSSFFAFLCFLVFLRFYVFSLFFCSFFFLRFVLLCVGLLVHQGASDQKMIIDVLPLELAEVLDRLTRLANSNFLQFPHILESTGDEDRCRVRGSFDLLLLTSGLHSLPAIGRNSCLSEKLQTHLGGLSYHFGKESETLVRGIRGRVVLEEQHWNSTVLLFKKLLHCSS